MLKEPSGSADVLVVVLGHSEISDINTKNGPNKIKRIKVVDESGKSCEFAAWREFADELDKMKADLDSNCILAICNATFKNSEI